MAQQMIPGTHRLCSNVLKANAPIRTSSSPCSARGVLTQKSCRMALIEVKSTHVAYWKSSVSTLGFLKEVGTAAITGGVANTGISRELTGSDLEQARKEKN